MTASPADHLRTAIADYPDAARLVSMYLAQRGGDLPRWPRWCFLPMAGWYAIVGAAHGVREGRIPFEVVGDVSRLAAIGTWRYSQGIYRLDPDLLRALADSDISGQLPSDVLYRLPEWCVYMETPGLEAFGAPLVGYWAHLEWDVETERSELRLLLDLGERLVSVPLHLGDWTVSEALDRMLLEAVRQARGQADIVGIDGDRMRPAVTPLVSILLYLCSEEPEIDNATEPGASPQRPRSRKTKAGTMLVPPTRPTVWQVGAEIGRRLRDASERESGEAKGRRAHLRRGHWHGYWLGPRDGERKFVYRWISPLIVSGGKREDS